MAKRDDTKGWKPERLGSLPASAAQGRDISKDVDRASKSRTATSLRGSAKDRTRC